MILDMIIEKKKTTLEEELMRMLPREQGKITKQMKLYDSLFVIREIKKAGPSKGVIVEDLSVVRSANVYDEASINAISILTERNFSQGGLENIEIARSMSNLPILRKDSIIDAREVVQTKRIGVSMILPIMAMLDNATLREFYQLVCFLDPEYIVEIHSEKELEWASQPQPEIIGINNRDLHTSAVSLETTKRLASRIPTDISIISESRISTHEDMEYVRRAGVDAVLIGESFMRYPDIRIHLQELKYGNCKAVWY